MKGYIYLTISIIAEVFATTMLKLSEGFTVMLPSVGVIIGYVLAFYFISKALQTLAAKLSLCNMVRCWDRCDCDNRRHFMG